MKRFVGLFKHMRARRYICFVSLLLLFLSGCHKSPEQSNILPPEGHMTWFPLQMNMDYDGFVSNYGDILSEEEFNELARHWTFPTTDFDADICVRYALDDGTEVTLVLGATEDGWEKLMVTDIEVIFPEAD